jgi:hypothetical protein
VRVEGSRCRGMTVSGGSLGHAHHQLPCQGSGPIRHTRKYRGFNPGADYLCFIHGLLVPDSSSVSLGLGRRDGLDGRSCLLPVLFAILLHVYITQDDPQATFKFLLKLED